MILIPLKVEVDLVLCLDATRERNRSPIWDKGSRIQVLYITEQLVRALRNNTHYHYSIGG